MVQKTFVLDTNVLLHDPDSIFVFADNKVVIPMTVIEELDMMKHRNDELGKNSRLISRKIDMLRRKGGSIINGIKLDNGGMLKIELDWDKELPYQFIENKADHRILAVVLKLKKQGEKVIFITKDINLRIKAEALGVETQDYEKAKVRPETVYSGYREYETTKELIDKIFTSGRIVIDELIREIRINPDEVYYNEFFILRCNKSHSVLVRIKKNDAGKKEAVVVSSRDIIVWGLKPLNVQQRFAIDLLLDDKINLVTLIGVAGGGKTLLSVACGLHKVIEEKVYRRLLVSRPVVPMGRDIGYLPGTKEEKLSSWMGAIYDNLEFLTGKMYKYDMEKLQATIDYYFDSGLIEVEALTYLRGRSLPNQFFIIDDAQNLTPHEIKTIVSRAGEGSKIVLTGDLYQIDNPYLDDSSNGLIYLVDKFKGQEIFGHITFTKTERSQLAALAAELL
ncbi:MAG: PhoH family protein [Endomicrobia bacterium]|nr:PhoH family protein [Endomicrobiia bacterium]